MYDYKKLVDLVISAKKFVVDDTLRAEVKMKGDSDFVTEVDLRISSYLKDELYKLYPEISFMSEEAEYTDMIKDRWILDPIDGTTNLVFDYHLSSISLALMLDGDINFGVVYNPFYEELFVAVKGKGAYYNGKKLPLAPDRDLKNCLIEFGAGSTHKEHADVAFEKAKNIFKQCLDLRRICSSALAISYIACGRINGYFEQKLMPWDYAAAKLILEECGGIITDWDGNKMQFNKPSTIMCGTKKAYELIKKEIQK